MPSPLEVTAHYGPGVHDGLVPVGYNRMWFRLRGGGGAGGQYDLSQSKHGNGGGGGAFVHNVNTYGIEVLAGSLVQIIVGVGGVGDHGGMTTLSLPDHGGMVGKATGGKMPPGPVGQNGSGGLESECVGPFRYSGGDGGYRAAPSGDVDGGGGGGGGGGRAVVNGTAGGSLTGGNMGGGMAATEASDAQDGADAGSTWAGGGGGGGYNEDHPNGSNGGDGLATVWFTNE